MKITLFFCASCISSDYHEKNEVISALAMQMPPKKKGETWEIYDGPGSEKGLVNWIPGTLLGNLGKNGWNNTLFHAFQLITQAISNVSTNPTEIILIGCSRGGIICHKLANLLYQQKTMSHIAISIIAIEPTPGPYGYNNDELYLSENVKEYHGFYAMDEKIPIYIPIIPKCKKSTSVNLYKAPGNHLAMMGLKLTANMQSFIISDHGPSHIGMLIKTYCEKILLKKQVLFNYNISIHNHYINTYRSPSFAQRQAYQLYPLLVFLSSKRKILDMRNFSNDQSSKYILPCLLLTLILYKKNKTHAFILLGLLFAYNAIVKTGGNLKILMVMQHLKLLPQLNMPEISDHIVKHLLTKHQATSLTVS